MGNRAIESASLRWRWLCRRPPQSTTRKSPVKRISHHLLVRTSPIQMAMYSLPRHSNAAIPLEALLGSVDRLYNSHAEDVRTPLKLEFSSSIRAKP